MLNEFVHTEGSALVNMELRISATQSIPILDKSVIVSRVEFTETCDGISEAMFVVYTSTRDYVDKILKGAQSSSTPRLRWRIGVGSNTSGALWMPWQEHIIKSSSSNAVGLGSGISYTTVIKTADLLWEIDRINKTEVRKGKISDIVKGMVEAYELPYVIEPTKTKVIYYQSFISDYEFIRKRIAPRAINEKKRGNYQFYMRDGTVHFHTIDYQSDLKSFTYYGSPGQELTVYDRTQELIDAGVAGVKATFCDPYTGMSGAELSSPKNTLKLGNAVSDIGELTGAKRNIFITVGNNREADQVGLASNIYESAKLNSFTLSMRIPNTTFFRVNDLCNIIIQPSSGQAPSTSGIYQVFRVLHNVDNNSLISEIVFRRGEFTTKQKTFASEDGAGQAMKPIRTAEGQDPNFRSVASSAITKGTGKQISNTRTVLDTLNPNLPST